MDFPLLSVIIFIPILGALVIVLLPGQRPTTPRWIALIFTAIPLALAIYLYVGFQHNNPNPQFVEQHLWIKRLGISYFLGVDGLSLPMVLLTALLTCLSVIASWRIDLRTKEYFALLLVLEMGVLGVFTALDLFLFFMFWEVELIPMYFLIGIWGGPRREYAAIKFVIYTVAGSAFMLAGILALYFKAGLGTFNMLEVGGAQYTSLFQAVVFFFLFIGFAVKVPVFPFHTWLPDAHVEAPTAISVLLAGVLLKMGAYGLLRINFTILPGAAQRFALVIAILAVINILYGAAVSMMQRDLKKLVAYSSVSHMGYVLLGISALNVVGMNGAVLQMFTHGTITGLLFLAVGLIYEKTHTREIGKLGGVAARMPWVAVIFIIAGLASLGLPGMSGFVSEFLVFLGAFRQWTVLTAASLLAVVITAGYILWTVQRAFHGPLNPNLDSLKDAKAWELVPCLTLVAVIILVGVYPSVVTNVINSAVVPLAQQFAR